VKSATILVVDDEPQIRRVIRATLSAQGYAIVEARDGQEALLKVRSERPDLVLLDMNMPVMDGLEACREMRAGSDMPIIMLTVRNAEKDKVRALDAGADDYVVKPFGIQELLARIRAALRRSSNDEPESVIASKELNFDFAKRAISVRGKPVHLTPKEFDLLRHLVANRDRPISHRRLLQAVWGPDYGEETESLRVVINQLRKKIESDPAKPKYILTEPWVGYRFVVAEDAPGRHSDLKGDAKRDQRPAERASIERSNKDS
jgi:two-component system KDP operon response regulator KdpE